MNSILEKFKHWQRSLSGRRQFLLYLGALALWAALFSDLYNIDLLTFWQGGEGFLLLLSIIPTMLLLQCFSLMRWGGLIPMIGWLILCMLQTHILHVMNFRMSFGVISNIFEASSSEFSSFLTTQNLITASTSIILSALFIGSMTTLRPHHPHHPEKNPHLHRRHKGIKLTLALTALTLISSTLTPARPSVREASLWPLNNIADIYELISHYWEKERPLMNSLSNLPTAAKKGETTLDLNDLIVIFHFGESSRADHWSLYGYERSTTPHLQKEAQKGNLVYFPQALSYAAGTRLGVIGILTPAELNDRFPKYGPFFDLFKDQKFSLQAYRSNQKADDQSYDSTLKTVLKSFDSAVLNSPHYAETLLPDIQQFIESAQKKSFIFYYGEGSHAPYEYNPTQAQFLPDDMDTSFYWKKYPELINRYDNTIIATDYFISEILKRLPDKPVLYIYTSDHGEFLGENGRYSHGDNTMNTRAIRSIPFFIWASPAYQKLAPDLFSQLRKNAANLPCVSHDHVFHTTLGLSGLRSQAYKPYLDLSSPKATPYTGPMPEDIAPDDLFESLIETTP